MKIVIGTMSPPKIAAIKSAIEKHPISKEQELEFISVSASSGVSDMPLTLDESMIGARNRVLNIKEQIKDAGFYVGMEGATQIIDDKAYLFGAIYIANDKGEGHYGFSPMMEVPEKVREGIYENGEDLGPLMDKLSGLVDIKSKGGSLELWSDGLLSRQKEFEKACICAFAPFFNEYYTL